MRRDSKGFTLVELLAVMAIIAVLMAIVVPKIGDAIGKSRRVSCANNMKQIVKAMQIYQEDYPQGLFPTAAAPANMLELAGRLYYLRTNTEGDQVTGITSMKIWHDPASSFDPPVIGAGYGAALTIPGNSMIDYMVFTQNNTMDFKSDPDKNIVLVGRAQTGGGANVDFWHNGGVNTCTWDSSVKFYPQGSLAAGTGPTPNANPATGAAGAAISGGTTLAEGGASTFTVP